MVKWPLLYTKCEGRFTCGIGLRLGNRLYSLVLSNAGRRNNKIIQRLSVVKNTELYLNKCNKIWLFFFVFCKRYCSLELIFVIFDQWASVSGYVSARSLSAERFGSMVYENKWGIGINFTIWEALSQTASDITKLWEMFQPRSHNSYGLLQNLHILGHGFKIF